MKKLETYRCLKCGRMLRSQNKKKLCRCCYVKVWKIINHNGVGIGKSEYKEMTKLRIGRICTKEKNRREAKFINYGGYNSV